MKASPVDLLRPNPMKYVTDPFNLLKVRQGSLSFLYGSCLPPPPQFTPSYQAHNKGDFSCLETMLPGQNFMTFSCIVLPSNLQYFTPTLYTLLYSHYECVCVELGNVLKVLFNTLENCLKNTDKYNEIF